MKKKKLFLTLFPVAALSTAGFWLYEEGSDSVQPEIEHRAVEEHRALPPADGTVGAKMVETVKPSRELNEDTATVSELPSKMSAEVAFLLERPERMTRDAFSGRLEIVALLNDDISATDCQALCDFLQSTQDNGFNSSQLYLLKNNILNKLRKQKEPIAELTQVLSTIAFDESQPLQMRDYALQHLSTWRGNAPDIEAVHEALWRGADEQAPTLAGTSMLSLNRLRRNKAFSSEEEERFQQKTLSLLQSKATDIPTLISSLQIASQLGLEDALAVADDHARNHPNTSVQMAAIATLGDLGTQKHSVFLSKIAQGENRRLHKAAQSALQKIQERHAENI